MISPRWRVSRSYIHRCVAVDEKKLMDINKDGGRVGPTSLARFGRWTSDVPGFGGKPRRTWISGVREASRGSAPTPPMTAL